MKSREISKNLSKTFGLLLTPPPPYSESSNRMNGAVYRPTGSGGGSPEEEVENPSTPYDMLKKALEGHGGGNTKPHKLMLCKTIENHKQEILQIIPQCDKDKASECFVDPPIEQMNDPHKIDKTLLATRLMNMNIAVGLIPKDARQSRSLSKAIEALNTCLTFFRQKIAQEGAQKDRQFRTFNRKRPVASAVNYDRSLAINCIFCKSWHTAMPQKSEEFLKEDAMIKNAAFKKRQEENSGKSIQRRNNEKALAQVYVCHAHELSCLGRPGGAGSCFECAENGAQSLAQVAGGAPGEIVCTCPTCQSTCMKSWKSGEEQKILLAQARAAEPAVEHPSFGSFMRNLANSAASDNPSSDAVIFERMGSTLLSKGAHERDQQNARAVFGPPTNLVTINAEQFRVGGSSSERRIYANNLKRPTGENNDYECGKDGVIRLDLFESPDNKPSFSSSSVSSVSSTSVSSSEGGSSTASGKKRAAPGSNEHTITTHAVLCSVKGELVENLRPRKDLKKEDKKTRMKLFQNVAEDCKKMVTNQNTHNFATSVIHSVESCETTHEQVSALQGLVGNNDHILTPPEEDYGFPSDEE